MTNHNKGKEFLVGAAIGGLLGTVAALLVAPKAGKKLREDICDTYCNLSESTEDMVESVSKKSKDFVKDVGCCTGDLTDKAKDVIGEIAKWIHLRKQEKDNDSTVKDFAIGGIAGGVLGAALGLLLAPKSGDEVRQDIADRYEDVAETAKQLRKKGKSIAKDIGAQTTDWLALAEDIVDQVSEKVRETRDDVVEKGRSIAESSQVQNIMDWASLGVKLWRHMKKRG